MCEGCIGEERGCAGSCFVVRFTEERVDSALRATFRRPSRTDPEVTAADELVHVSAGDREDLCRLVDSPDHPIRAGTVFAANERADRKRNSPKAPAWNRCGSPTTSILPGSTSRSESVRMERDRSNRRDRRAARLRGRDVPDDANPPSGHRGSGGHERPAEVTDDRFAVGRHRRETPERTHLRRRVAGHRRATRNARGSRRNHARALDRRRGGPSRPVR